MSFEQECSVTLLFCTLVLAFVCGLMYFKMDAARDQVRMLRLEVENLRSEM